MARSYEDLAEQLLEMARLAGVRIPDKRTLERVLSSGEATFSTYEEVIERAIDQKRAAKELGNRYPKIDFVSLLEKVDARFQNVEIAIANNKWHSAASAATKDSLISFLLKEYGVAGSTIEQLRAAELSQSTYESYFEKIFFGRESVKDLSGMKAQDLKALAKELGIAGRSKATTKQQLVDLIASEQTEKFSLRRRKLLTALVSGNADEIFADERALYLESDVIRKIFETEIVPFEEKVQAVKARVFDVNRKIIEKTAEKTLYSPITSLGKAQIEAVDQEIRQLYKELGSENVELRNAQRGLRTILSISPEPEDVIREDQLPIPLDDEFGFRVKVILQQDTLSKVDPGGFIPGLSDVTADLSDRKKIADMISGVQNAIKNTTDPSRLSELESELNNLRKIDSAIRKGELSKVNANRLRLDERFSRLMTSGALSESPSSFTVTRAGANQTNLVGQRVKVTQKFLDSDTRGATVNAAGNSYGQLVSNPNTLSVEVGAENLIRDEVMRRQIRFSATPVELRTTESVLKVFENQVIQGLRKAQQADMKSPKVTYFSGDEFDLQAKNITAVFEDIFQTKQFPISAMLSNESVGKSVAPDIQRLLFGYGKEGPFNLTPAQLAENTVASVVYQIKGRQGAGFKLIKHLMTTSEVLMTESELATKKLLQEALPELNNINFERSSLTGLARTLRQALRDRYPEAASIPLTSGELTHAVRSAERRLQKQLTESTATLSKSAEATKTDPLSASPEQIVIENMTADEQLSRMEKAQKARRQVEHLTKKVEELSQKTGPTADQEIEKINNRIVRLLEVVEQNEKSLSADIKVRSISVQPFETAQQSIVDDINKSVFGLGFEPDEIEDIATYIAKGTVNIPPGDIPFNPFIGTYENILSNLETISANQMALEMQLPAMPGFEDFTEAKSMRVRIIDSVLAEPDQIVEGEVQRRLAFTVDPLEEQDRVRAIIFYNQDRLAEEAKRILGQAASEEKINQQIIRLAQQEARAVGVGAGRISFEARFTTLAQRAADVTQEQLDERALQLAVKRIRDIALDGTLKGPVGRTFVHGSMGNKIEFKFKGQPGVLFGMQPTVDEVIEFLAKNPDVEDFYVSQAKSALDIIPGDVGILEPVLSGEEIGLTRGVVSLRQLDIAAASGPNTVIQDRHTINLAALESIMTDPNKTDMSLLRLLGSQAAPQPGGRSGPILLSRVGRSVEDLSGMKAEELRALAKELGIAGRSKARTKQQLVDLIAQNVPEITLEDRLVKAFESVGLDFQKVKDIVSRIPQQGLPVGDQELAESFIDAGYRSGFGAAIYPDQNRLMEGMKVYSPFDLRQKIDLGGGRQATVGDFLRAIINQESGAPLREGFSIIDEAGNERLIPYAEAFAQIVKNYLTSISENDAIMQALDDTEQSRQIRNLLTQMFIDSPNEEEVASDTARIIFNGAEEATSTPYEQLRDAALGRTSVGSTTAEAVATGGMRPAGTPTGRKMLADFAQLMREDKAVRYGAYGVAAIVSAGLVKGVLGGNKEDMTEEEFTGPPNLPGGNPYSGILTAGQSYTAMGIPGYQPTSASFQDGGVTYQINARGNYDPATLQSEIEAITQSTVGGTITRGIMNPQIDYDDIAGGF